MRIKGKNKKNNYYQRRAFKYTEDEYLWIKKLYLNWKGNSIFASNLLQFIEGDWDLRQLWDSYIEMENVSKTLTTIVSNAISTHKDIQGIWTSK